MTFLLVVCVLLVFFCSKFLSTIAEYFKVLNAMISNWNKVLLNIKVPKTIDFFHL